MLDKTANDDIKLQSVDGTAPAIFVRMTSQVGPNRSIEMSFGIPLDMTPSDLNTYLDKVSACADRQHNKGMLEETKLALLAAQRDLMRNMENRASYEAKAEGEWYGKGKRGAWVPNGTENAQIKNFQTTDTNIREAIIPRLEKQIAELEEKIR